MVRGDHYTYSESQPMIWWGSALLWVSCGAALLGILAALIRIVDELGWLGLLTPDGSAYLVSGLMCILFPILIQIAFGKLTVAVGESEVVAFFGVGWIRKRIPFSEIREVTSVTYNPLGEFLGWGIRGMGKKRAWTMRGNQAVVLRLRDGVELYLGADTPERLRERIQTAMRFAETVEVD